MHMQTSRVEKKILAISPSPIREPHQLVPPEPTHWCAVRAADRRCRAPSPRALLIGIKVFWWGRLLIRLERHVSKMWRLFRPAQGLIDQSVAILAGYTRACVCVCVCVCICLSIFSDHTLDQAALIGVGPIWVILAPPCLTCSLLAERQYLVLASNGTMTKCSQCVLK